MSRSNPWLYGAALFSAVVWAALALTAIKLDNLYVNRGPHGFRNVIAEEVDMKVDRLTSFMSVPYRGF